ncbi:MAG: helix-turn-helix transcriptional regulator [Candidatus Hydrogenedentes bacterium]|nr:helix-turn-helix transcriptional regulator [Candidatus Hydrogenedentota bacterium]
MDRTVVISAETIHKLRALEGLSLPSLARKAKITQKTLNRWLKGEPAFFRNVKQLAKALNIPLRVLTSPDIPATPTADMSLTISIKGAVSPNANLPTVTSLTPKLISALEQAGFSVDAHTTSVTLTERDGLKRTISLIFGLLDTGKPFWLYAAVRPSRYKAFLTAQNKGTLDLHKFDPYGEIIVSGEGNAPPDEVTLKVAEIYQIDPVKLTKTVQQALDST